MSEKDIRLNLTPKQSYSINQLFHHILHFDEQKKMVGFWNLDKKKQQALLKFAKYLLKEIEKGMTKEVWQQLEIIHLDGGFKRCIEDLKCIINTYEFIMDPDFKDKTLHLVSDKGRNVKLYKTNRKKGTYKILSGCLCDGYKTITHNKKTRRLNRIIYLSLHPSFKQEVFCVLVVDHLDEDKLNDALYNLDCITNAENIRRAHKGKGITHGDTQSIPIVGTNLDTKEIAYFTGYNNAANQLGSYPSTICNIIHGKLKKTRQKSTGHWWTFCIDESKIVKVLPGEKWKGVVIYEPNENMGLDGNENRTFELLEHAANKGDSISQYNLGYYYEHGKGVAKDYGRAFEYYRKAANQGHGKSQYRLGWCYYRGIGVIINEKKGLGWLKKAAKHGYVVTYTKINALGYKISNYGRYHSPHQIPAYANPRKDLKYCSASITLPGKSKQYGIHQLVLWAFEGPPPIFGQTPDHKDQNRSNNKLSNLRYATRKIQVNNQTRSKRKKGQLPIEGEHWTLMRWPDKYKGH